jgi:hypothetical protein
MQLTICLSSAMEGRHVESVEPIGQWPADLPLHGDLSRLRSTADCGSGMARFPDITTLPKAGPLLSLSF